MEAPVAGDPAETTTLTLAFDATRTQLVDGKTAWAAGDKVRILNSDGKYTVDVEVPADQDGKTSFDVEVKMKDTSYFAVYPVSAAEGIADNKVKIRIPSSTSGRFADANICAAKAVGTTLSMRNVTSVLKLNVNSGNVVEMLQIASKNPLVGAYSVDLSGEAPALAAVANDTTKSVTVAVGGVDGDYFVAVAPVEIDPGLSITALRGNGGYQTLTSGVKNTLEINKIFDLGVIGNQLTSGLTGEGTESNPFLLTNAGEFGAFAASVNLGKSYEDQYVSLQCDMVDNPVTTPIGFYISDDEQAPFSGHFLGNNHKIKVDLDGINSKDPKGQHYVALFGELGAGSSIADLEVEGVVKATGDNAAGLVGSSEGTSTKRVTLTNIKSNVTVNAEGDQIAGIAGYACYTDISGCHNTGAISGNNCVAGIGAYLYNTSISDCSNTAIIASTADTPTGMYALMRLKYEVVDNVSTMNWTNGTGGIAGFAQNSNLKDVNNSGAIGAYMKVGGIAGVTYWTPVDNAENSGTVTATGDLNLNAGSVYGMQWGSVAGGIVGWLHTYGNITNSTNHSSGIISGKGGIGGIVGVISTMNNASAKPVLSNCKNSAKVSADGVYCGGTQWTANPGTGGICGTAYTYRAYTVTINDCVNDGEVIATNSTSSAHSVGGILGLSYGGNNAYGGSNTINRCVNNGNITAGFWVGGIIGLSGAAYSTIVNVYNSVNHGTVTGTGNNGKYAGVHVGGIAGGIGTYNGQKSPCDVLNIKNCYNDGDVYYSQVDNATPYAGGIVGNCYFSVTISGKTYHLTNNASLIQNVYNLGYVGPIGKVEPATGADAYIGSLAGHQRSNCVHFSYFSSGVAVGSASTVAARTDTVCSFDPADGTLAVNVTANNKICDKLLDALNEWQNYYVGAGNVYYNWTGPAGHPVFADTMD